MGFAVMLKRWFSISAALVGSALAFPVLALVTAIVTGLTSGAVALLAIARAVTDRVHSSHGPRTSRHGTSVGFRR